MEKGARAWFAVGAALLAAGVAMDAWHAHGLSKSLPPERADAIARALDQQYLCALGLIASGLWLAAGAARAARLLAQLAAAGFLLAALLFSGSLYLRELTGAAAVVAAAPYGGSLHILSWLLLAASAAAASSRSGRRGAGTQI
ncbi:MAG: DUF423 domain-containing protein [Planctomycetota bacterium]|nr:MAG: DUF423 domain-containing protein [Planctomycetota bacterium]